MSCQTMAQFRRDTSCLCMQVVVDMVKNKLAEEEVQKNGWLLDGYPRR